MNAARAQAAPFIVQNPTPTNHQNDRGLEPALPAKSVPDGALPTRPPWPVPAALPRRSSPSVPHRSGVALLMFRSVYHSRSRRKLWLKPVVPISGSTSLVLISDTVTTEGFGFCAGVRSERGTVQQRHCRAFCPRWPRPAAYQLLETEAGLRRTLSETQRTVVETDARSCSSTHDR
jgi:hypothetical protein